MPLACEKTKSRLTAHSPSVAELLQRYESDTCSNLRAADRGHTARLWFIPLPFRVGSHDGRLNAEEIATILTPDNPAMRKETERSMRDVIGDGQITYSQFADKQITRVKAMLQSLDTNKDGRIQSEELLNREKADKPSKSVHPRTLLCATDSSRSPAHRL